jgi:hypothetical protein
VVGFWFLVWGEEAASPAYTSAYVARASRGSHALSLGTLIIPRAAHHAFAWRIVRALERRLLSRRSPFACARDQEYREDERERGADEHQVQVPHRVTRVRLRVFMPTGNEGRFI